ncbi:glycosyl transferase [Planctomycetales bacterium]|nr:glycosyl transferase [Planctomycetales bacterium]
MSENIPLVSIIMPSYNSAQYLVPAIQSVISQTFTDWELLIFNDGSTDNTEDVVKPLLTDKRIQYIEQENLGQPKTRNKGVRMSKGKYIALLDADDIWMPDKLEKQIAVFEKYPDAGVCGTGIELIRPDGTVFGQNLCNPFYGRAVPALITGQLQVAMSASITRKDVFKQVGFWDEGFLPFSMDYDFWLRASLVCMFYNIEEKLIQYRTGHPSISSEGSDKRRNLVMNIVVPRFVKEYGGSKYVKWYHVWQLYASCYFGKAMNRPDWFARTYWLFRSFFAYPFQRDTNTALIGQFLPARLNTALKSCFRSIF